MSAFRNTHHECPGLGFELRAFARDKSESRCEPRNMAKGRPSKPDTRVVETGLESRLALPGVKLVVIEGPDRGMELTARRGIVKIGTASDNDLALSDTSVSRQHVELRLRADDVTVRDLGSTNGTTVDGVRVVEAVLSPASHLRIGDTSIRATPFEEPVVIPLSSRTSFGGLIGASAAMREVFAVLERVSGTEATVLVEGETGTGKELVAEGIHDHSSRAEGPFVPLDCGAVTASLMESELFGHVRGAFTGAVGDRQGVFEAAHGGTLFLDELGELPLELQPKLLRALEKREIRRVGDTRTRKVDVRVVAATNRDLVAEVNRGAFREDLYFRLAVVHVKLPPLRARRGDIPMLVELFIEQLLPGSPPPSAELVQALARKAWPGNVRELRNAVERALALIGGEDTGGPPATAADPTGMLAELLEKPYKTAQERWNASFEVAYVEHALRKSGGSVSGAARDAEVTRRHIQRLMKRHNLRREGEE